MQPRTRTRVPPLPLRSLNEAREGALVAADAPPGGPARRACESARRGDDPPHASRAPAPALASFDSGAHSARRGAGAAAGVSGAAHTRQRSRAGGALPRGLSHAELSELLLRSDRVSDRGSYGGWVADERAGPDLPRGVSHASLASYQGKGGPGDRDAARQGPGYLPVSHRRAASASHALGKGAQTPRPLALTLGRCLRRQLRLSWTKLLLGGLTLFLLSNLARNKGFAGVPGGRAGDRAAWARGGGVVVGPGGSVAGPAPAGDAPAPAGDARAPADAAWEAAGYRIPRLMHQTYASERAVPSRLKELRESWRRFNPGWEPRFYDDAQCLAFVEAEFPEYAEAYRGLPKDVERADFFRYLVVLRYGGLYGDIDTECRVPIESLISPGDAMVVGYEAEFPTWEIAWNRHYARKRQVEQWFFAAAPGHPVLRRVCDWIADHYDAPLSDSEDRDTLERTGPGVWTDMVLRHALEMSEAGPGGALAREWPVRVFPRVAFGSRKGHDGIPMDSRGIAVVHHFSGSWKASKRMDVEQWKHKVEDALYHFDHHGLNVTEEELEAFELNPAKWRPLDASSDPDREADLGMYPVTVPGEPTFDVMTRLMGHGEIYVHSDVSAELSTWGEWQPLLEPGRSPSVLDVLLDALDGYAESLGLDPAGVALVEAGAGTGFLALAAASKGYAAEAFEAPRDNVELLEASVARNPGFDRRVRVYPVALGDGAGGTSLVCVRRGSTLLGRVQGGAGRRGDGAGAGDGAGDGEGAGEGEGGAPAPEGQRRRGLRDAAAGGGLDAGLAPRRRAVLGRGIPGDGPGEEGARAGEGPEAPPGGPGASAAPAGEAEAPEASFAGMSRMDRVRAVMRSPHSRPGLVRTEGHGLEDVPPAVPEAWDALAFSKGYSAVPGSDDPGGQETLLGPCLEAVARTTLDGALGGARAAGLRVGAVHVSAFGHERDVLAGARRLVEEDRPAAVLVEYHPDLATIRGGGDLADAVGELGRLGYAGVAHAGRVCDRRWRWLVAEAGLGEAEAMPEDVRQPTWCRIDPADFPLLADEAVPGVPELVLFTRDVEVLLRGDDGDGGQGGPKVPTPQA